MGRSTALAHHGIDGDEQEHAQANDPPRVVQECTTDTMEADPRRFNHYDAPVTLARGPE